MNQEEVDNLYQQGAEDLRQEIIEWLKQKYEKENDRLGGIKIYEDLINHLNK